MADVKLSIIIGAVNKAAPALNDVKRQVQGLTLPPGVSMAGPQVNALTLAASGAGAAFRIASIGVSLLGKALSAVGNIGLGALRTIWEGLQRVGGAIKHVITRLASLTRWLLLAGAALSGALIRQAINNWADYSQAISNAGTVTGLAGAELKDATDKLTEFGLAVSRKMATAPTKIAEGFYGLASAGLRVNEVMAAAPPILALAEGTMTDVGQATELTVAAVKAFGLGFDQTARVVNVFGAAISNSMMNMERLGLSLPYVAGMAAALGISLETTVATLATLVDRGLPASTAGAMLRMMFARLIKPTTAAKQALAKYGLTAADVNVAARGLYPVLRNLQAANISAADASVIFGTEASSSFLMLMSAGVPAIEKLEGAITGTNRAMEMQAAQVKTAQGVWNILKSTAQELSIRFGRGLSAGFEAVTKSLQGLTEGLLQMGIAERAGQWVSRFVVGLLSAVDTLRGGGSLQEALSGWLGEGAGSKWASALDRLWQAVKQAVQNISAAFGGGGNIGAGIEGVILGIVNAIAGAIEWLNTEVLAPDKLNAIKEFFRSMYDEVRQFLGGIAQFLANNVQAIGAWLLYFVDMGKYAVAWVQKHLPDILDTFVGVFAGVAEAVLFVVDAVTGLKAVWDTVINGMATVLLGATYLISAAFATIVGALALVFPSLRDAADRMGKFAGQARAATGDAAARTAEAFGGGIDAADRTNALRERIARGTEAASGWSAGMRANRATMPEPTRPTAPNVNFRTTVNVNGGADPAATARAVREELDRNFRRNWGRMGTGNPAVG